MNIQEEKLYLENKITELEKELNNNIKEQKKVKSVILHWSYTARIQQLEKSLDSFKRSLHFVHIKEGLDELLVGVILYNRIGIIK